MGSQITMIETLHGTMSTFLILELPCDIVPIGVLSIRIGQRGVVLFVIPVFPWADSVLRQRLPQFKFRS